MLFKGGLVVLDRRSASPGRDLIQKVVSNRTNGCLDVIFPGSYEAVFPVSGILLLEKAPFHLLLLLAHPVSVVKFAIPCFCLFIVILWHIVIFLSFSAGQGVKWLEVIFDK